MECVNNDNLARDKKGHRRIGLLRAIIWFGMVLLYGVIFPNEREGTIETAGCRTTIINKKRPTLDYQPYTCIYERKDSKNPARITGKYCARVETESGVCTLAEIYSETPTESPTGRP